MTVDLILGTAGHIDHGKSALVRALTGRDTDRLPEEKRRGITIELGFAELELGNYRLGIVDVPGHERFVRTMLAGATGMDLALLVVAADDSVKPQTREHLDILRLLDLQSGVIAITKCDLAEPDWIDLVEEEVRELLADTFLARAPLVRTSSHTGEGIERLRACLATAAAQAADTRPDVDGTAPFRMAIDRCFTIPGHGTVVTGSVSSGQARVHDELVLQPGAQSVRIRGLQNHDRLVDQIHRGQRAAINLAGVHHEQVVRGQELASSGHLAPSRLLTARLSLIPQAARALKTRSRIRVHLGTAELLATVVLWGQDELKAGQSGAAQLHLNQPAAAVWGQPLVLRTESPVHTIGGGAVLDPNATKLRKPDATVLQMVEDLQADSAERRAAAAIYFLGLKDWQPSDLARKAGIANPEEVVARLREQDVLAQIPLSPKRTLGVHREVIAQISERIALVLDRFHREHPLRSTMDRHQLASAFAYLGDPAVFDAVLQEMQRAGRIRTTERGVALAGAGPQLSANERKLLAQLIEIYRQAGLESPTVDQCRQQAAHNAKSVPELIALAAADGDLVEIAADHYIHRDTDHQLQQSLSELLGEGHGATLSEIRELWGTTRKWAVPYCEYLDRIGFTRRQADLRYLAGSGSKGDQNP